MRADSPGAIPAELGFHMPAEWEPHKQCWMGWPERPDNWRNSAGPAQKAFSEVATAIDQFEPITVCANASQLQHAREMLPANVRVVEIAQDDAWFRDSGPTFVVKPAAPGAPQRQVAGVDWQFNAWGGLYADFRRDQQVARRILELEGAPRFEADFVLEGGSIHTDGEGTLLTTEECLLNSNRNPQLSRDQIEQRLKAYTGVEKVLWLPKGLYADHDTNGHIDNFACFARPGVVLLAWTDDQQDPQWAISNEALELLGKMTDARGRSLQVIKLPLPPPQHITPEEASGVQHVEGTQPRCAGDRMAASYINFYLPNGGLVMPAFGVPEADGAAKAVLEAAFPGRKVVAVASAREILLGGGNIHCITQQQPSQLSEEARDHGPLTVD